MNTFAQPKQDAALVDGRSCISNTSLFFAISRLSVSKVKVLDGSIEGKHLLVTCTLTVNHGEIPTHSWIKILLAIIRIPFSNIWRDIKVQ